MEWIVSQPVLEGGAQYKYDCAWKFAQAAWPEGSVAVNWIVGSRITVGPN
jgi:hypothetical protein